MKRIFLLAALFPFCLSAHSGHGLVESGPAHYLFSPEHGWALLALSGALYLLFRSARRNKKSEA